MVFKSLYLVRVHLFSQLKQHMGIRLLQVRTRLGHAINLRK